MAPSLICPPETAFIMKKTITLGLMSGTSLDGVDAVAVDFAGTSPVFLGHHYQAFPKEVRAELLSLCSPGDNEIDRAGRMSVTLAKLYAQAIHELLNEADIPRMEVAAAGVHGQTIRHRPEEGWTLQLNNPAWIAELAGVDVIADFRSRDVAAGGLGAPLVPYTEFLLYRSREKCVALQNIGGIGNVTVLPRDCRLEDVFAFDTGPGNMLMDALVERLTNGRQHYDAGGKMAAQGRVDAGLLAFLMQDPYLQRKPPKTTGREAYGAPYLAALLDYAAAHGVSLLDTLATVTRFTAECIAYGLQRFSPCRPGRMIVGGGGCYNLTLMAHLRALLPDCRVMTNEDLGLDGNAKEAVAFALLADETIFASCNNAPGATGARHPVVMGKISL